MNIITRSEAKTLGLKQYFNGKPCPQGHVAARFVANGTCSECLLKTNRAWKMANPETAKASVKLYRANNADVIREKKREYNMRNADAIRVYRKNYNAANHERRQAFIKDWRQRHIEHRRAYQKEWQAANPEQLRALRSASKARRRMREAQDCDAPSVIAAWVKAAPKVCYWCNAKCRKHYHIDHYQPLAKGGKHKVGNLVIACRQCNQTKSAKDPLEFAASVGRLF